MYDLRRQLLEGETGYDDHMFVMNRPLLSSFLLSV